MKLNKFFLIFSIIALLSQTLSISAFAQQYSCTKADKEWSKRLIKENLVLTRTLTDLNSETAKPCDKLQLKTMDDIDCGNKVIIPCGSIIEGKVVKAKNNFILRSDAYIDFLITNIKTSSGCNICLEQDPIKLRIVDPHYKSSMKKLLERAPIFVAGPATSIPLGAATALGGGVIFAITIGAQATAGFLSGLIYPDIDKTRIDGAIIRAVEGTPVGTFRIVVERGFEINSPACCYVTIRLDDKAKQQILCSMQRAIATNKSF
ncbi:MAG: hypothetical protein A2039_05385 [Candidatus Melainabacteria bacterium GWA2_34_9]|nr:MAG: hypothetical protein A2039_05385 [Candidatus Melainabacteria bacterium GWA2_34_9]